MDEQVQDIVLNYIACRHENDPAKWVFMYSPGMSSSIQALHPAGALFDKSFSTEKALAHHEGAMNAIREEGIVVVELKDVLRRSSIEDLALLASSCVSYQVSETENAKLSQAEHHLVSDAYKLQVLLKMDRDQLIEAILVNPTVSLQRSARNTPLTASSYNLEPLGNMVFTRDQMIVTRKGIIFCNMASTQRFKEVRLIRYCMKRLGVRIAGKIPKSCGTLEGGDFVPAGEDLCFIGSGMRTSEKAINYLLENDLFGTKRVAVVKDIFERDQERMHLDCIFNIAHDGVAVLHETAFGSSSLYRRLVTEYTRQDRPKEGSKDLYSISKLDVEFSEYLVENGYHIISIPSQYQHQYGINFINLGKGNLLCIHEDSAKLIQSDKVFAEKGGRTKAIPFSGISAMYGGIHCATQVFRTSPLSSSLGMADSALHKQISRIPTYGGTLMSRVLGRVAASPDSVLDHTHTILVVPPTFFEPNEEVATENPLLKRNYSDLENLSKVDITRQALSQFSEFHQKLVAAGINIRMFVNQNDAPNSVFVSSLFSTYVGKDEQRVMVVYPIKEKCRRNERHGPIADYLRHQYPVVIGLTGFEQSFKYLAGEASLVISQREKIAFMGISSRSNLEVAETWSSLTGYKLVTFHTQYRNSRSPIAFTSSVISLGKNWAIACFDVIEENDQESVKKALNDLGKTIIEITVEQMERYCAQVRELRSARNNNPVLVVSKSAHEAFTKDQLNTLAQAAANKDIEVTWVIVDVSIMESYGGGSVNSMMVELW